jgi:hypothetical protein
MNMFKKLFKKNKETVPTGSTHDYTRRSWGHDYTYKPLDPDGLKATMMGWGCGIKVGDYLLLENDKLGTRYIVDEIKYFRNPYDMWEAKVSFAPRQHKTQ